MTPRESLQSDGDPSSAPGNASRRSGILMGILLLIGTLALVSVFLVVKGREDESKYGAGRSGSLENGVTAQSIDFPEDYPRTAKDIKSFTLVDQDGQEVKLDSLKGRVVYVAFAFGGCHSACPVLLKSLEAAHERLRDVADVERPAMLIVSLDPKGDVPAMLPQIAKRWDLKPGMQFLSGPVDDVEAVIAAWNIPRSVDETTGEMVHPPMVFVVDQQGKLAYSLNNPSTAWIVAAGRRLLASTPDQASGH